MLMEFCKWYISKMFITCRDYVLIASLDMVLHKKKARSKRYLTETITDADHADDIVFLANIPTQAESMLHSLDYAAGGIGLHT